MVKTYIDAALCALWLLTYVLVVVGVEKYKLPLISPVTPVIIVSFELSALFKLIVNGDIGFDHVSASYICWSLAEIAIIIVLIRRGFICKQHITAYLSLLAVLLCVMCYLVIHEEQQFFFSYLNTFIGDLFWLIHICKKDFPVRPIVLILFFAKFIADVIAVPVYFGAGSWRVSLLCVLLPITDFLFIHVIFRRLDKQESFLNKNRTEVNKAR